ncbi:methionyl-tRNA formyltransferase [Kangiella shandongensis]|uniref:methionyl-tRNA formyltransferase n=1 Tax=Kangiella shandongensis TaxID=2763258 RepID=UPI001CBC06E5|nr:methionyl-tRNA formyltransferase [Kangiella shandongensis]
MNQPLKVIFAGTPDFAATSLQSLIDSPHQVIAVYTQPDRQSGRGKKIHMSPVKELALTHQIPVEQPQNFKSEQSRQILAGYNADVMVVAAYGLLLPQAVLDIPRLGCINVHGSLLPRWRGAAPIQRAIQAGDSETGVTIMQMEAGLDTGPMLAKAITPITAEDTGATLHDKLAAQGAQLLVRAMDEIAGGTIEAEPQDDGLTTYAHKLSKQEAFIDWSLDATTIERTIRAFNSWPVAQTQIDDKTIRIWQTQVINEASNEQAGTIVQADKQGIVVACGQHQLRLTELQLPGSRRMSVKDLLNAPKNRELLQPGSRFH